MRRHVAWHQRIKVAPKEQRTVDGVLYASKSEALRARELKLLFQAGEIRGWQRQPTYELGCPENKYRADFVVYDDFGQAHVEDVKGFEPREFKRWKRLWRKYGKCPLVVLRRRGDRWEREIVNNDEAGKTNGD